MPIVLGTFTYSSRNFLGLPYCSLLFIDAQEALISLVAMHARQRSLVWRRRVIQTMDTAGVSLGCNWYQLQQPLVYSIGNITYMMSRPPLWLSKPHPCILDLTCSYNPVRIGFCRALTTPQNSILKQKLIKYK